MVIKVSKFWKAINEFIVTVGEFYLSRLLEILKKLTSGANVMKAKAYSLAKAGRLRNEAAKFPHLALGMVALLP
jgi:hypothetical protein